MEVEPMNVNWKVRFKNKAWLCSFFSLIISFIYTLLSMFDVFPAITQNTVMQVLNQVLTMLGLLGVIQDPTTVGLNDSKRALSYEEPWDDDVDVAVG
jgi:phi LC3 family holin